MRPSDRFTLAELPVSHPHHEYQCGLVCDGASTDVLLMGDALAVQYECDGVFLVVTHYDHYEAVAHWFYVLTREGKVLDQAATPDYFGFYGTNDQWRVRVRQTGFWSFTGLALRLRLNRFFLRKRYMSFWHRQGARWAAK